MKEIITAIPYDCCEGANRVVKIKPVKSRMFIVTSQGGLDYGPVPDFDRNERTGDIDFTSDAIKRMRQSVIAEHLPITSPLEVE